ncbi:MAG: SDR family oxidoreductase [Deltaproteobacteria bacterium]|nr:SDR family oxidoreductase [Deltaproteobacteria bacterium]
MNLAGRTALVTGAARRLGRAIAEDLADGGARVAVCHRTSTSEAEAVIAGIRAAGGTAEGFTADLADPRAVERLAADVTDRMGPVDVLVNNASVFYRTPLETLDVEAWDAVMAVNLKAPYLLSLLLGRAMRARGTGKIVNLADIAAERPYPGYLPYSVSKAGIVALTRALALDLAPAVQVNCVAPGPVLEAIDGTPAATAAIVRRTPLGRLGDARDVAAAVRFLVAGSDFVTGTTVVVDGGRTLD